MKIERLEARRLLAADFNEDGIVDIEDANQACTAKDFSSLNDALEALGTSNVGDHNLDGKVDSDDLIELFSAGKYENFDGATWAQGDATCNGYFSSDDLIHIFDAGYYNTGRPTLYSDTLQWALNKIAWMDRLCVHIYEEHFSPEDITYDGDINRDGVLDQQDIDLHLQSVNWIEGDYDFSGVVENRDRDLKNRGEAEYQVSLLQTVTFHKGNCLEGSTYQGGIQPTIDNNINQEQFVFDFNGDGFVASPLWEFNYFEPSAGVRFADASKVDSNYADMAVIMEAAAKGKLPDDPLSARMDLDDDGDIDYDDVDLALVHLDFAMFDYNQNGRLDVGDYNHFHDFEGYFGQWRRTGERIDFIMGDLNLNGIADQGDVDLFDIYYDRYIQGRESKS